MDEDVHGGSAQRRPADFASNPFNGPIPSVDQVKATLCENNNGAPGCVRRDINNNLASNDLQVPYSYQSSIGFQRQLGQHDGHRG